MANPAAPGISIASEAKAIPVRNGESEAIINLKPINWSALGDS